MSLYDDIDTVKDWSTSKPSTSSIKLLQDHLQVKKTTQSQSKSNPKPTFKPMTISGQKRNISQSLQHSSLNSNISYSSKSLSPLGGDWDINNEYDPFRPSDYEKIREKIYRKKQSKRSGSHSRTEPNYGSALGLNYDDDDEEDDDRYRRKSKNDKPRGGAAFAPPSSLIDDSDVKHHSSSKQSSSSYSHSSSSKSNSKILDPVANMMAKMGYQPGQGLGREKQGITSALQVEKTGTTQGKIILEQNNSDNEEEEISRVIMLRNMVGPEEVDEALEEEIIEECTKYGKVLKCSIFQVPNYKCDEDAVRIFVEFSRSSSARDAHSDLNTRYFAGRKVIANFYDEHKFHQKSYMY